MCLGSCHSLPESQLSPQQQGSGWHLAALQSQRSCGEQLWFQISDFSDTTVPGVSCCDPEQGAASLIACQLFLRVSGS